MKKTLYAVAILLAGVLMLGTAGALEQDLIPLWMGAWQMAWSLFLGLWGWFFLALEEHRAAHRISRSYGI